MIHETVTCDSCGTAADCPGGTVGKLPRGWTYTDLADLCPSCSGTDAETETPTTSPYGGRRLTARCPRCNGLRVPFCDGCATCGLGSENAER